MASTSPSLLGRLRDLSDPQAWQEFERRYRPRIMAWCREKGLQDADAEDVTQEVMLRVARRMPTFVYTEGDNFSSLLRAIWHNAWVDFVRERQRKPAGHALGEGAGLALLLTVADDDLSHYLKSEIDAEELHEALARVQPTVKPHNWQLFVAVSLQERATAEVAAEHGISVEAAYMALGRVRLKVKKTLRKLRGGRDG